MKMIKRLSISYWNVHPHAGEWGIPQALSPLFIILGDKDTGNKAGAPADRAGDNYLIY